MIISVVNQKGGTGKTTTALTLWYWLNAHQHNTLIIDMDSQGNTSYCAGADTTGINVLGLLTKQAEARQAIQSVPGGDIIPASKMLASADQTLTDWGREYLLKEAIESIRAEYEYIIIDCPPALNVLSINALAVSNKVIIPALADIFSFAGLAGMADTMANIKQRINPALTIDGILLTKHTDRTNINKQIKEAMEATASKLGTKLYHANIREGVQMREAQAMRKSIFDHAPKSNVAADYEAFIKEFMEG